MKTDRNALLITLRCEVERLREIERAAMSLVTRDDFWRNAGTLPGEYDNLRDALGMKEET